MAAKTVNMNGSGAKECYEQTGDENAQSSVSLHLEKENRTPTET
jgi:hypothetical protein